MKAIWSGSARFFVGVSSLMLFVTPATAQVRQGAIYAIALDSVNAGGDALSGATFQLGSSVGQDGTVGTATGAVVEVCAGLWCASVDCDMDEDGAEGAVCGGDDCDDTDPNVGPGAYEFCNGIDDDCDGVVDEDDAVDAVTWYDDADLDQYGDPGVLAIACVPPTGFVANPGDCNDNDGDVYPGAPEHCDGVDEDCDGVVDEDDAVDVHTWYLDLDQDGFGDAGSQDIDCDQPAGFVADGSDCDDTDADQHPAADEFCNGEDDDCDGQVDDAPVDPGTWYIDADQDGFGDPSSSDEACDPPPGYADNSDDCDDGDPAQYPGADEYCNGADDDCDGAVDESGAVDALTWYLDADGDTFGSALVLEAACDQPPGFVTNGDDCDDGDAAQHPGADEYCNGEDDDCQGDVDEDDAVDVSAWYLDADGDQWGDPGNIETDCDQPPGHTPTSGDCDDTDPTVNPAAQEVCNGIDDDCDALTDELADVDGDGYAVCDDDCDDAQADVFPGNPEICDGLDNDCDPATDESLDADGDSLTVCDGDCDDDAPDAFPGNAEVCDGVDNDCDGVLPPDEFDEDADGQSLCGGDCNDQDAATWLGAPEQCDGLDNDCDGIVDNGVDQDLDGDGFNACQGDCDNADATVYPGAAEACDSKDNDCDGDLPVDEQDLDADLWLTCEGDCDDLDPSLNLDDADGDLWTTCDGDCDDADDSLNLDDSDHDQWTTCAGDCDDSDAWLTPEDADGDGFSSCGGDCDDANALANPGDDDGDGWSTCDEPPDCSDTNDAVSPGHDEICADGFDNNCDGLVDGDDPDCAGDDDDDAAGDDDTEGDDDMDGGGCECSAADSLGNAANGWLVGGFLATLVLACRVRRRLGRDHLLVGLMVTALCLTSFARAQSLPSGFNYQGRITLIDGTPVEGQTPMTFRLYDVDQGGVAAWEESQTVEVDAGVFSVLLGAVNPLSVDFAVQLWLDVEVDGDPMGTRIPLVPVPYAHHAINAELLDGVVVQELEESYEIETAISGHEADHHVGPLPFVARVVIVDASSDLNVHREYYSGSDVATKTYSIDADDLTGAEYVVVEVLGDFRTRGQNGTLSVSLAIQHVATGTVLLDSQISQVHGNGNDFDTDHVGGVVHYVEVSDEDHLVGMDLTLTTTAHLDNDYVTPYQSSSYENRQVVLSTR
jgi:hypothetical protein